MIYLLDTHVLIWLQQSTSCIPRPLLETLSDPKNDVFVSALAAWEVAIKTAQGKLALAFTPAQAVTRSSLAWQPLDQGVYDYLLALPPYHRDPFDRLLIAQALQMKATIVTNDAKIRQYEVPVLWD
jgi:PIN domain nuclease of toxin-antitoxin system